MNRTREGGTSVNFNDSQLGPGRATAVNACATIGDCQHAGAYGDANQAFRLAIVTDGQQHQSKGLYWLSINSPSQELIGYNTKALL